MATRDIDVHERRRREEIRREILSGSVLWRICAEPCAKHCARAKRCTSNRDRCVERLFPKIDASLLRWQLRAALLMDDDDAGVPRSSAQIAADDLEADGITVPDEQTQRVERIVRAYRKACDEYRD
jgi:hypothetical protein